jgi:pyruvate dehydrogenase E2 component (dihydrolipoamide acetyltransferase)
MPVEVILPKVDMDMATGKIIRWHAKEGEPVKMGKPLFDIESDKATMEIESPADGILGNVTVNEGQSAPVGQAVAYIFADGEARAVATKDVAAAKPAERAQPKTSTAIAVPEATAHTPGLRATPLARRVAREAGIDLTQITGSGPHGRIVAEDVRKAGSARPAPAGASVAPFHLRVTCTIDGALDLLDRLNRQAPKNHLGAATWTLSVNDLIIKAMALALQKVPEANVSWRGGQLIHNSTSDIAIVEHQITAVIASAEAKSLSVLVIERVLGSRPSEGGSIAITTLGVEEFTATVQPPQAMALAIGAVADAFVPVDGQPVLKKRMSCVLSCDPRAVDAAIGAQLLQQFRTLIEDPALMLA